MAINLFGDPFNLQGSGQSLQGGYNPQQVANPLVPAPVAPVTKNPTVPVAVTPRPRTAQPAVPRLDTSGLVGSSFAPYIGARPSAQNASVAEFFRTDTNQALDERGLFDYASSLGFGQIGSFDQIRNGAAQSPQMLSTGNPQLESYENSDEQLARAAAQAGLSLNDYLSIVSGGRGITPQERDEIRGRLGIPGVEQSVFGTPTRTSDQIYQDAYKSSRLGDLKAKIEKKLSDINAIQNKYIETADEINENPWLSEASRVGKLSRLKDKRQAHIGNLQNEVDGLMGLYENGVNEVNSLVTRISSDLGSQRDLDAQKLKYLLAKSEEQIQDAQKEKSGDIYSYLPAFLKAKASAQKPDTIGSNETGFYRWNPDTQTFEQVIAPSITPNYQANPLTGELFNTKDGNTIGSGNTIAGLAQAVLNNPAAYSQLTTQQQGAVNNYLAQNGIPIPTQLTTEQKNKMASLNTLQQTINSIEGLGNQINWSGVGGAFKGSIQQFLAKNFGKGSKEEQMLRSFIGNLQATIAKERGGTSFTANEQALLEQYVPTINDSPAVIQSKLAALKTYLQAQQPATGGQPNSNPSDPLGLFSSAGNASASTPYLKTLGSITGLNGSPVWQYGLDVDLKKGDPVRSPVSGTVIAAAPNGGFGNQVKIKTSDGKEIWLSHLDRGTVKVGQQVNAGQLIGYGGTTGTVIPGKGGDGSHLDITIKDSNGKLLAASQVKSYLDNIYV